MENFTPVGATVGGVLIGLSAVMLMGLHGRIAGVSGVFAGIFFSEQSDRALRIAFLLGLVISPVLYSLVRGAMPPFTLDTAIRPLFWAVC